MISYSALTSYGKSTLPSVEVWNGNFNIVKDPPSSIHTRRIIKVGDNNDLLDWNDDSGSRINEMINIYARGNNPMVSVQYSNHGNTGSGVMGSAGGTVGSDMSNLFTSGGGGKLPYRIMDSGAFRPPILRQEDLLPLSRMPRSCTSMTSKRCKVDQTKKITPDVVEYFKQVHNNPIKASVESKKSFKKDVPHTEPLNISLMTQNKVKAQVDSNLKKLKDHDRWSVNIPTVESVLHVSNTDHINRKTISQQKYIHDDVTLSKNVPNYGAQTSSNLNIVPNKSVYELGGQTVKLTNNRPFRGHSTLSANSGPLMLKLNQEKIITGVKLKLKK
jgi:hypothetical protein